jgi:hypothetical protein
MVTCFGYISNLQVVFTITYSTKVLNVLAQWDPIWLYIIFQCGY